MIEQSICSKCPNDIKEIMDKEFPEWVLDVTKEISNRLKELKQLYSQKCFVVEYDDFQLCLCKKHLQEIINQL